MARYGSEIESIYLLGDFAVAAVVAAQPPAPTQRSADAALPPIDIHRLRFFHLTAEPATISGDLVLQGYPFYAGAFDLSTQFTVPILRPGARFWLRLARPNALAGCGKSRRVVLTSPL